MRTARLLTVSRSVVSHGEGLQGRGVCIHGGICIQGEGSASRSGEVGQTTPPRGCLWWGWADQTPWSCDLWYMLASQFPLPHGQANSYENITLPQTSFAGGKKTDLGVVKHTRPSDVLKIFG